MIGWLSSGLDRDRMVDPERGYRPGCFVRQDYGDMVTRLLLAMTGLALITTTIAMILG